MILFTLSEFQQSENWIKDALIAVMPAHIHFKSLQERMEAMAQPTAHVGEVEILQTANAIGTKVIVSQSAAEMHYGNQTAKKTVYVR